MVFDKSNFPQFVPVGEYRVDVTIFVTKNGKEEFLFLYQEYIEVKPLGILQF